jgi:uncharacterized protein YndB with AHSA1/START domain
MTTDHAAHATVLVETTIAATAADVWRALTEEIDAWWPDASYSGGSPDLRSMRLDARPGGQMAEHWGDGEGLVWGTVNTVERERLLEVSGLVFPRWGGPSMWFGSWELQPDGDRTRLRFTEAAFGRIPDGYRDDKEKGWRFLFDGALKAYLERREPPVWEDERGGED